MKALNFIHDEFWFWVASPVCNIPKKEQTKLLTNDVLETLTDLENRDLKLNKNIS